MQNLLALSLLSTLPFILAAPPGPECRNGSFDLCVGSVRCTTQWPDSCLCLNRVKTDCAIACRVPIPKLQDCSGKSLNEGIVEPWKECVCDKPLMCLMKWPDSCWCDLGQKRECAKKCGKEWDEEKESSVCPREAEKAGA